MPQHTPSSMDVSIWKRNAKKLAKKDNISLSKALEIVAKEKGFSSWKHLVSTSQTSNSILNDPEVGSYLRSLPMETQLAAERGDYHVRKSYIKIEITSPKDAKKEIIQKFKELIKRSKRHIEIRVWLQVPSKLIANLNGEDDMYFYSIREMCPRINEVVIDSSDRKRNAFEFGKDPSDPLTEFLSDENEAF